MLNIGPLKFNINVLLEMPNIPPGKKLRILGIFFKPQVSCIIKVEFYQALSCRQLNIQYQPDVQQVFHGEHLHMLV